MSAPKIDRLPQLRDVLQFWALVVVGGLIYWLPSIVAFARISEGRFLLLAVNFLLGWTVLGWIGALVWTFEA